MKYGIQDDTWSLVPPPMNTTGQQKEPVVSVAAVHRHYGKTDKPLAQARALAAWEHKNTRRNVTLSDQYATHSITARDCGEYSAGIINTSHARLAWYPRVVSRVFIRCWGLLVHHRLDRLWLSVRVKHVSWCDWLCGVKYMFVNCFLLLRMVKAVLMLR